MEPTKTKNNKKAIKALLQRVQRETYMNDILRTRIQTLQHRNANDAETHDRFVAENRILQAMLEELQQAVLLAKDTAAPSPKESNKISHVFQNAKKAALSGATVVPRGKLRGGDGRRVEQTTKKILRKQKPSKATTWQQKSCGDTNSKTTKLPDNMTKATKPTTANPQRLGRKRNAPEKVNQQQQQQRETTKPTKKRKTVLPPRRETHFMYKCPVQGCTHVIPFAKSLHPPLYHGDDSRHAVSDQKVVGDEQRFQSQIQMARSHMRQQHKDMNASASPLAFQQHVPLAAVSTAAAQQQQQQQHVGSTTHPPTHPIATDNDTTQGKATATTATLPGKCMSTTREQG